MIFDGNIIKTLIIYTKAKSFISLLIKKNRCFSKKLKKPNKVVSQISLDVSLQGLQLHKI